MFFYAKNYNYFLNNELLVNVKNILGSVMIII